MSNRPAAAKPLRGASFINAPRGPNPALVPFVPSVVLLARSAAGSAACVSAHALF